MNTQICSYTTIILLLLLDVYCSTSLASSNDETRHQKQSPFATEIHTESEMMKRLAPHTKILCALYGRCNNNNQDQDDEYPGENLDSDEKKHKRLSAGLFHGIPKFGKRAFSFAFSGIPKFG